MNCKGYSLSVDIWSLGCTIIEMATARPPWHQYEGVGFHLEVVNFHDFHVTVMNNTESVSLSSNLILQVAAIFKIANSKDIPEIPDSFSEEGKSFLQLCLKRNPASRASAVQLMDHPFVQDHPAVRAAKSSVLRNTPSSPADGRHTMVLFLVKRSQFFLILLSFYLLIYFPSAIIKTRTSCNGLLIRALRLWVSHLTLFGPITPYLSVLPFLRGGGGGEW
jgi:serine/threonine protein kinase